MRVAAVLLLACAAGGTASAGPDGEAEPRYREIQRQFARRPRAESKAALEALVRAFPDGATTADALLWLGELSARDGEGARAERCFEEVRRRFPSPERSTLALRGLGDLATERGLWTEAIGRYHAAAREASPVLRLELVQKEANARTARWRFGLEVAAWLAYALCLGILIARLRGRRLRLPKETWFLAPVYALLIAGTVGRDPAVRAALCWFGGGSLVLVTLAFAPLPPAASAAPPPRRRVILDGALLALATCALFWIAVRRAEIVEPLRNTILSTGID